MATKLVQFAELILTAPVTLTGLKSDLGFAAVASSGSATDLTTGTVAVARLPVITVTTAGIVPAPGTSTGKFLRDDLTWSLVPAVVSGSGTAGYVPLWSSSTVLGNSVVQQASSQVLIGGVDTTTASSGQVLIGGGVVRVGNQVVINGSVSAPALVSGSFIIQSYAGASSWVGDNIYYNGGWKYFVTAAASSVYFNGGSISFNVAVPGTAGATMSYLTPVQILTGGALGYTLFNGSDYGTPSSIQVVIGGGVIRTGGDIYTPGVHLGSGNYLWGQSTSNVALSQAATVGGAYVALYDTTNSAYRGYIGYGSSIFSGGAITDFGIASSGALKFASGGGVVGLTLDVGQNVFVASSFSCGTVANSVDAVTSRVTNRNNDANLISYQCGSNAYTISSWVNNAVIEAAPGSAGVGSLILSSYTGSVIIQTGIRTTAVTIAYNHTATFAGPVVGNQGLVANGTATIAGASQIAFINAGTNDNRILIYGQNTSTQGQLTITALSSNESLNTTLAVMNTSGTTFNQITGFGVTPTASSGLIQLAAGADAAHGIGFGQSGTGCDAFIHRLGPGMIGFLGNGFISSITLSKSGYSTYSVLKEVSGILQIYNSAGLVLGGGNNGAGGSNQYITICYATDYLGFFTPGATYAQQSTGWGTPIHLATSWSSFDGTGTNLATTNGVLAKLISVLRAHNLLGL